MVRPGGRFQNSCSFRMAAARRLQRLLSAAEVSFENPISRQKSSGEAFKKDKEAREISGIALHSAVREHTMRARKENAYERLQESRRVRGGYCRRRTVRSRLGAG